MTPLRKRKIIGPLSVRTLRPLRESLVGPKDDGEGAGAEDGPAAAPDAAASGGGVGGK